MCSSACLTPVPHAVNEALHFPLRDSHSCSRKCSTSAKVLSGRRRGRSLSSRAHPQMFNGIGDKPGELAGQSKCVMLWRRWKYVTPLARCGLALSYWKTAAFPIFPSFGAWPPPPPIHIRPYHSGVLCLIQLKMESKSTSLIHHSIDIHLVALPQTYTEIYLHLYNVFEHFWPSLYLNSLKI